MFQTISQFNLKDFKMLMLHMERTLCDFAKKVQIYKFS
jgi:hypothetical protein